MGALDGKIAIITGAGSGIGRASALRFAAEGAKLVIGDKTAAVHETAQLVKDAGGEADAALMQLFAGLNPERILGAAMAVGLGRYALDAAVKYAKERTVWKTPRKA